MRLSSALTLSMASDAQFSIEIVAGLRERQRLIVLQVSPGTTVREAVEQSKILRYFPEFDREALRYGVWGVVVSPDRVVSDGERVEIYRPLIFEPREARRQLAAIGKTMRDGRSD
jgi:putative ubiquitin-RnfH superfamily antitoxin RatB of RatAB toxin-antitoxin module